MAARRKLCPDWRLSWILACVAWGALLTWIVEAAAALHILSAPVLFTAWLVSGAVCGVSAFWLARQRGVSWKRNFATWLEAIGVGRMSRGPLDTRLMLAATGLLIVIAGLVAGTTPTTNWDSLTYHLPRVLHWIQQGSVDHFATNNTCQIEYGPWSAYVTLNLHLLSGGDRWDNLAQWFAMVTSVVAGSFTAHNCSPCGPMRRRAAPEQPGAGIRTKWARSRACSWRHCRSESCNRFPPRTTTS